MTARPQAVRVRVQHAPRGPWEVVPAGGRGRTMCETLEDARRVASQMVTRDRPCELVVLDAYNRVLQHEVIDSRGRQLDCSAN